MLSVDSLTEIHLEPTERCNAACPMCGRNQGGGAVNSNLADREITGAMFRRFFPAAVLRRLRRLRLCGNFGDPVVNDHLVDILIAARAENPAIGFTLNTNGGMRGEEWWFRLGRFFRERRDIAKFSLDGLADTHSFYRRNTRWERVIANASAFLRGGGNAEWVFLVFRHNEHQVADARALAERLGFGKFTVKRTKRFQSADGRFAPRKAILDDSGRTVGWLEMPADPRYRNPALANGEATGPLRCRAERLGSLFVSAEGLLFPCCWTAASLYPADGAGPRGAVWERLAAAGGKALLSLHERSFDAIVADERFQALFPSPQLPVCRRLCGPGAAAFDDQRLREER